MSRLVTPAARETLREGATEVREKLREDLSHWGRVRRYATLKPTMGCQACDMSGKVTCSTCGGSGQAQVVLDTDQPAPCATCAGTGLVTCVDCAGTGRVPNVHRKKVLWVLAIGGLAWIYVLFRLWGGDVLPEQLNRGGGKVAPAAGGGRTAPVRPGGGLQPGYGAPTQPGVGGPGLQPGVPAPGTVGQPGTPGAYAPGSTQYGAGATRYPTGTGAPMGPAGR